MTQETVLRLIEKNLTAIYGYAFNKLYDKSEAEESIVNPQYLSHRKQRKGSRRNTHREPI